MLVSTLNGTSGSHRAAELFKLSRHIVVFLTSALPAFFFIFFIASLISKKNTHTKKAVLEN